VNHPTPSIDEIFFAAMERESLEARAAYLDEACGADFDLRRRVERLLAAQQNVGSFLDSPAAGPTMNVVSIEMLEGPGTVIGPYKLLEQIGEGGMGIVYMAEQAQPVRRKVALKIIKPGMDTRQVIARFEAERQALAMMDHPNIAKVLDAGATESGRPYFVMELVRGVPLTEYCDQHRLPINKRLDLFMQVCQAVQHAHQKGIIHRDIKPTNVLVTALDGVPLPRVIDFGIAKATGQSLTDKTLFTGFAQLIGTPLYMSPEQAELSAVDVDTRSDIYSLGVLLYELLTGTTPFDQDTFRTAALDEVRRIIREEEPPKPSTRLSGLGATLTTVSDSRQTDARTLSRSLRGELDWIVMKALEKDRGRRYDTASDLARDVERYLAGDVVEAGPPSGWYRVRKYVRRNRLVLTTTVIVGLALIVGTTVSFWQAIVARRARADATLQRDRARDAETEAVSQRNRARRAVDEMYTEVAQKWLSQQPRLEPLQRDFLLKALAFYQDFARDRGNDPEARAVSARAELRAGDIQKKLGERDSAERAYRRALELQEALAAEYPKDLAFRGNVAASYNSLGQLLGDAGQLAQAESAHRRAIDLGEPLLAEFPRDLEYRRIVASGQDSLGQLLRATGRLAQAESAHRRAVEHGNALLSQSGGAPWCRRELAVYCTNFGYFCRAIGRPQDAESAHRRALDLMQGLVAESPKDPGVRWKLAGSYTNLDSILADTGRLAEADAACRKALALYESLADEFPRIPDYRMALICGSAIRRERSRWPGRPWKRPRRRARSGTRLG
jgi:eukaryotic-like serine/threonine-protein kinase